MITDRSIIGRYFMRLEALAGESYISKITMPFLSDQDSEKYEWLNAVPAMKEFIGGLNAKGFIENNIEIKNKLFESTIRIPRKWLYRDKTGQISIKISELSRRTIEHWDKLVSTLINGADALSCYDGQFFFDTDHSEGKSGTISNLISVDISTLPTNQHGSVTKPSPEEMELAILEGVQQMFAFKDDQGEPMNGSAKKFVIMVPVPYLTVALAACKNPVLTSGKTSTIVASKDAFELTPVVNPRLSWTDKFAIFRADSDIKPIIRQAQVASPVNPNASGEFNELAGVRLEVIGENSEHAIKHEEHIYTAKAERNTGLGFWQLACQVRLI